MVHTPFEEPKQISTLVPQDEKEIKRIMTLEFKVAALENTLLKASTAALEKRVEELEAELQHSNEECQKLREKITQMEPKATVEAVTNNNPPEKNPKTEISEKKDVDKIEVKEEKEIDKTEVREKIDVENSSDKGMAENSQKVEDKTKLSRNERKKSPEPLVNSEDEDAAYERILKAVEKMKNDCIRAINFKIPTGSKLPKNPFTRQDSKSSTSKPQSPVSPSSPISPSTSPQTKMPLRTRTPSCTGLSSGIPSRPSTPSGIPSSSNTPGISTPNTPTSGIPLSIPSKTSSLPMRSATTGSLSRPTTPITTWPSSSPLCSPTHVPHPEDLHATSQKAIPIPVRIGVPSGTGNLSRPSTPGSKPSTPVLSSPLLYHSHLSTSPPSTFGMPQLVEASPTRNTLRARASSYSLNSSRPGTPFKNSTLHAASVQN